MHYLMNELQHHGLSQSQNPSSPRNPIGLPPRPPSLNQSAPNHMSPNQPYNMAYNHSLTQLLPPSTFLHHHPDQDDINPHRHHSKLTNRRRQHLQTGPATRPNINMSGSQNYRLQRFRHTYATCPSHVLVCLKGAYSLLSFKCLFCARDSLGVIYQCNNCGTFICGSCKESNRKFKWTRGKDPDYFGH